MRFGKQGNIWVWFWIFVAIIAGAVGLYLAFSWLIDGSRITGVGVDALGLILV